ncbi:MAG: gliding motility protein GldL, partial [Bacteroidetes bacterium]|nr:gliding motility protein GldL [Bacteroidota bacterium]
MLKKFRIFFESEVGKQIKNMIIGLGASVVLVGALFKIMHWPGAGVMLTIGMLTEAFIFALQGMLPPHADYYWEKLYPNLNIAPSHDPDYIHEEGHSLPITQQLDKMLDEGGVSQNDIESLGEGLKK